MKKTFLFCTPWWLFLCEIPLILLLIQAIALNGYSDNLVKLYPLILTTIAAIIVMLLYLFKVVIISNEEIKISGLFSSKDSAIINKDRTLMLRLSPKGRIKRVILHGTSGLSDYSWARAEDYTPPRIDLFREKALGGTRALKRVLTYFGIPSEDIAAAISESELKQEYASYILEKKSDGADSVISLYFKESL